MRDDIAHWLLHFDDPSVGPDIYTDEKCARYAYESATQNWECALFVEASELTTMRKQLYRLMEAVEDASHENICSKQWNSPSPCDCNIWALTKMAEEAQR